MFGFNFGQNNQQQSSNQQQPNQNQQQNPNIQQNQQVPNGQNQQNNPNATNTDDPNALASSDPNKQQSPEALYKDLFSDPIPDANADVAPEYKISPDHLKKVSDSLDFSKDFPQEIVEKMQNGESPSWQDLVSVINHVGRRVYATTMEHQSSVTGKFVDLHSKHSLKGVPAVIKEHMMTNHLQSDSSVSNPVVQEQLITIGKRIAAKHPNASPEWIKQQAKEYFVWAAKNMSPESFNSNDGPNSGNKQQQTQDWDAFMKIG